MKICAIVCEFNPFHNGHVRIIEQAKKLSACDYVVCVMSGQFTQRGEVSKCDKFLRAKHAILAGADAVIELPTPFAVAPAEIFADGAIKLISKIKGELSLCFGTESGNAKDFIGTAQTLLYESERFKQSLEKHLNDGTSYIKSYFAAFKECGGDQTLISSPNNVLGVEYCKAILRAKADIKVFTAERETGAAFAPAHTIRRLTDEKKAIDAFMPEYALCDFIAANDVDERFEQACADAIFFCDKGDLKRIYGCGEGLENRLKKLIEENGGDYRKTIDDATSKRYSSARIRRILTANLLKLYADQTQTFLNADLGLKILAVKNQAKDDLLPLISASGDGEANDRCYALTSYSYSVWRYLSRPAVYKNENEKMILV